MTGELTHTASKERNCIVYPSNINCFLKSEESLMLCFQSCSTCYAVVQINYIFKSTSALKIGTMKIYIYEFYYIRKPSCATTLFTVSKDEWSTNEESMKNAL